VRELFELLLLLLFIFAAYAGLCPGPCPPPIWERGSIGKDGLDVIAVDVKDGEWWVDDVGGAGIGYGTRSCCIVVAVVADTVVDDNLVMDTAAPVVVAVVDRELLDMLDKRTTAAEDGGTGVKDDLPPIPPIGNTLLPWSCPCDPCLCRWPSPCPGGASPGPCCCCNPCLGIDDGD
jgi:hypothetical protein